MQGNRLYKKEKLCSETAIGSLFDRASGAQTAIAYPLRAVWLDRPDRHADCPQFLIMVPKRRLRHAVDRVAMRRRIREAYRLCRRDLLDMGRRVDIAIVYVADTLKPYADVERSLKRLLSRISGCGEDVRQHREEGASRPLMENAPTTQAPTHE